MRYSGNKNQKAARSSGCKRYLNFKTGTLFLAGAAFVFGIAAFLPEAPVQNDMAMVSKHQEERLFTDDMLQNEDNFVDTLFKSNALEPLLTTVQILNSSGEKIAFDVEIADTPQKSAKGLMFRTSLSENRGMLFVAPYDQVWTMWMKNTYIPLDMIYFKRSGEIVKVIKNARPHDLTHLSSDEPVAGVLEIGGGLADKFGIGVGDLLIAK